MLGAPATAAWRIKRTLVAGAIEDGLALPIGWDGRISSIRVEAGSSVHVSRDPAIAGWRMRHVTDMA